MLNSPDAMPYRVVPVNPAEPRADRLAAAGRALAGGGIVALPTETFYGLAADAFDADAVARVNRLKGKPAESPALLLLADAEQVRQVSESLPEQFATLVEQFWPGPLTIVVPASSGVPSEVTGGLGTVAVRVPGLALPRRLAAEVGRPLTGVSANLTGRPPCRTALEVARTFPEGVELILDGGATTGGAPSTVLDLTAPRPRVLREGLVPMSALRPFLSELEPRPL
jgi:L-threonylcarbamoyladenylate synthase